VTAGIYLSLAGVALSATALALTYRRNKEPNMANLPDAVLYERGLWDECDGEPMNAYAEELDRRQCAALTAREGE
jgi:hypothetical protein